MAKLVLVLRILLGLIFTVFGLNGFLNFLPPPEGMPEAAGAFFGALAATGYMLPLIKGVEVVGGILLLLGRYVPLALILLGPVAVNILLFHLFLAPDPAAGFIGYLSFVLWAFLCWAYRGSASGILAASAKPSV
jgi:uncharacterized membrane protein YphA (DoxX/SURF4 family)